MKITKADWNNYIKTMSSLSDKASKDFADWANKNGGWENIDRQLLAEAAWSIASKYAEGSSALAAEMYDAIALAEKVNVPPAELASEVDFGQLAKAINGALKHSVNDDFVSSPVGRAVKQAGADTTLKNASRDGAEFAWIPSGDSCPFCLVLASNGWRRASKKTTNGNHASHIHTHCDCQFAIRFNKDTKYDSYDPSVYQKMYYDAEGSNSAEKIKYLQAKYRNENKDKRIETNNINLSIAIKENRGYNFGKRVRFKTGNMTEEEYNAYKRDISLASSIPSIELDREEYEMVRNAFNQYIYNSQNTEIQKRGVVVKGVRNHEYTVINYGFNDYKIIGRRKLK